MAELLWTPTEQYKLDSAIWNYIEYLEKHYLLKFEDYHALHQWSITCIDDFWKSIIHYFDISYSGSLVSSLEWDNNESDFTNAKWFDGISLSYCEHIFKQKNNLLPAVKYTDENHNYIEISWQELEERVSSVQQYLIYKGIVKGDRVVGILNNTIETIVIFLATNSLGAIWSCCSPDFGDKSIVDRFLQIQPKILFYQSSYQYNSKVFTKDDTSTYLRDSIVSIEEIIDVGSIQWTSIFKDFKPQYLSFERVEFEHPIWILYSSGTTGIPKAITHRTGGNLLEHYKALALHQNVLAGDNFLWYSTTGWMMWNYALSSLLCGATLCLFDGIINHDNHQSFWNFIKRAKVDHLGAGAVYFSSITELSINDYAPKVIASTGSPLPINTFEDLQSKFPKVHIISLSGGTDVCSAFLTGSALLPVYAGMLQCIALGADIVATNEYGNVVEDEVGELIIRQPMPSMPIYFWNDKDNIKYKESYFDKFLKVWAHGDWIKIIPHQGIIIYGRSDATLNRGGVRIGTAEIYNTVNVIPNVSDSLVITIDKNDGSSQMVLFVQLVNNQALDVDFVALLKSKLRTVNSPRHVPDIIYQVRDVPYTLSGKKLELPIKKIFAGASLEKAITKDIMRNPACLEEYIALKLAL